MVISSGSGREEEEEGLMRQPLEAAETASFGWSRSFLEARFGPAMGNAFKYVAIDQDEESRLSPVINKN